MRPVLTPSARRLWRDPTTLQLGHDTVRATVLAGVDAGTRAALLLLDGTRDRAQLLSAGAAVGCPPERMVSLLALLDEAGLLEDAGEDRSVLQQLAPVERDRLAADLGSLALVRGDGGLPAARHRRSTRVLVVGAGRVGAPLAAMLGTAGIGAVDVVDDSTTRPEDTGVGGPGPRRRRAQPRGGSARAAAPGGALARFDRLCHAGPSRARARAR